MKKTIIIFLLLIEILINEFTLTQFSSDKSIGIETVIKIRFFNLIIFISGIIIFFYYNDFLKLKTFTKFLIIVIYIFSIDFVSGYVNFGYPKSEKDSIRYIFPYDWIRGEPNKHDHNEFGFRGYPPNVKRVSEKFVIGFFGGSTGYQGNPTIVGILSNKLQNENLDNIVINFSSVSSNHNQHIHRLLEFYEYNYDLIIFYGGWNETVQHYYYDYRPGYPFNFYLHDSNSNKNFNFLIKKSNIVGEIDKIYKVYQTFNPKTSNEIEYKKWKIEIKKNYFKTIKKAEDITKLMIKPNKCKKTSFLPILQPSAFTFDKRIENLLDYVKVDLNNYNIQNFDYLTKKIEFIDSVHIEQKSKDVIAEEILILVKEIFRNENIC